MIIDGCFGFFLLSIKRRRVDFRKKKGRDAAQAQATLTVPRLIQKDQRVQTYIKHYPSRRARTLSNINTSTLLLPFRRRNHREYF